jgi:type IV pilus biogenesis protein CpaD/CtpE
MKLPLPLLPVLAVLLLALTGGCSKRDGASTSSGGHTHRAPHGGTLVEVGDHAYNIELVRDAAAGKLTAYVLDGHAENFIRINVPAIELVAITGGEKRPLTLRAVANSATGETVGDTSQFEAQADWLKDTAEFPGMIPALQIRGSTFQNVALYLRK